MKQRDRAGFTIVELVIVIAVIAVLASVLVPTFSGVIAKAQASAAIQQVTSAYKEAVAMAIIDDGRIEDGDSVKVGKFTFTFYNQGADAQIQAEEFDYPAVSVVGGKVLLTQADDGETENQPTESEATEGTAGNEPDVTVSVERVTLDQDTLDLVLGGTATATLSAVIEPAGADGDLTWTSGDDSIASVDPSGLVTAVSPGITTVTVTAGDVSASCTVRVVDSVTVSTTTDFTKALAAKDCVISLGESFKYTQSIQIGSSKGPVIIDLNGHTLTLTKQITVNNGADLTIINGTLKISAGSSNVSIYVDGGGKLTVVDCTLTSSSVTAVRIYGAAAFTDSTIEHSGGYYGIEVGYTSSSAFLKLKRTSISSDNHTAIYLRDEYTVDIIGGSITCNAGSNKYAIQTVNQLGTVNFMADEKGNAVSIVAANPYSDDTCFEGTVLVDGEKMTFQRSDD